MLYNAEYLKIDERIDAKIYLPESGVRRSVGILIMHSDGNYLEFVCAPSLAERGYTVLCANVADSSKPLDLKLLDVKAAINVLKAENCEKVVLLGHSGGATLMSAYQATAEKGRHIFDNCIIPMSDIGDLPAADGVMLIDANFGNGVMTLLSLDPSIIDEQDETKHDPTLDATNPENGFGSDSCSYSDEFVKTYVRAQGERMNRLVEYAQKRVTDLGENDEPLVIFGSSQVGPCNKIFPQMTKYFSHTRLPHDHILTDGSITNEIVPCVRRQRNFLSNGTLYTTVKTFLKSSAVRTTSDFSYNETTLYGVDWDSSFCTAVGNAKHISVPMLFMGMTASYEYIAAEHAYLNATSCADKTCAFVQDAGHMIKPMSDSNCDTVQHCCDYIDGWIQKHICEEI